jgi:hypothetical protein
VLKRRKSSAAGEQVKKLARKDMQATNVNTDLLTISTPRFPVLELEIFYILPEIGT